MTRAVRRLDLCFFFTSFFTASIGLPNTTPRVFASSAICFTLTEPHTITDWDSELRPIIFDSQRKRYFAIHCR